MKHKLSIILLLSLFAIGCSTVPLTNRHQLKFIPSGTMTSMSFQQYDDFLKNNQVIKSGKDADMVRRVGGRIQKAVEQYFKDAGKPNYLKNYRWEFNLVKSDQINAWCMPGGKVVVYSALLPVAKDETGLAVVLGHEIAHAIADHGNERMSQQLLTKMGGLALSEALKTKPQQTQQLWMGAFGAGAQYGILLPFSRTQESEADHLGLIFMAMAGYNPQKAIEFWERMSAMGGKKPPEFMSTHPSDQTRINDLKKLMPEAMKYYKKK